MEAAQVSKGFYLESKKQVCLSKKRGFSLACHLLALSQPGLQKPHTLSGLVTLPVNGPPPPSCPHHLMGRFFNSAGAERLNDLTRGTSLAISEPGLQSGPPYLS